MEISPEQWDRVKELYEETLECDLAQRADFLKRKTTDEVIRAEILRLLAEQDTLGSFLSTPPFVDDRLCPEPAVKRFLSGEVLAERFRIVRFIAAGGMGEVYEAEDLTLKDNLAIKTIRPEVLQQNNALERFKREVQLARKVTHPNICRVFDLFWHRKAEGEGLSDIVFVSMELLQGETLSARIRRAGRFTAEEALPLIHQIASGLEAAHRAGVVHRDLKPGNVILVPDGEEHGIRSVITDFGLALRTGVEANRSLDLTATQGMFGTPAYMAPEQIEAKEVNKLADIYALGLIVYEMVTGEHAFPADTPLASAAKRLSDPTVSPKRFAPELSDVWEQTIIRCLHRDPNARFSSAIEVAKSLTAPGQVAVTCTEGKKAEPSPKTNRQKLWGVRLGIMGLCALITIGFYRLRSPLPPPRVLGYRQLTKDRQIKSQCAGMFLDAVATDGPRVFFTEARSPLMQVSSSGGDAVNVSIPLPCFGIYDISPDKTELLGQSSQGTGALLEDQPMWVVPIASGLAQRLGNLSGHAGAWSPDGRKIVYATGGSFESYNDLYVVPKDGNEPRKLIRIEDGPVNSIRWSPDGKILRMTVSGTLWEMSADGTNLHPVGLFPDKDGLARGIKEINWTRDGRYFVFQASIPRRRTSKDDPVGSDVWAIRETKPLLHRRATKPVQLTAGAISFWSPTPSPDGKQIFAIGGQIRGELVRYDLKSQRLEHFLSGISADQLDFSRDGSWVTYVTFPEGTLWRSKLDGSERMQLTTPPLGAGLPRWSPDGTRIAFAGYPLGGPWKTYVISAEGGRPEVVSEGEYDEVDATWSPDGNSLIFGGRMQSAHTAISSVDLRTGRVLTIPGSEGMFSPRVSPDGRFIVAGESRDNNKQFLFDEETQNWSELMKTGRSGLGAQQWSSDSKYVYVADLNDHHAPVLYRVRIADRKVEHVAVVEVPEGITGNWYAWMAVTPDGSPLLLRDLSIQEIYALDVDLP